MAVELTLAEQREMVAGLRDPTRYAHPVTAVTVIETHISFILLTGPFAYKIKKAVNLGFVDYGTLARRHHFCAEELRLNRRLAPGLYRDVVAISGSPGRPRWGDGEETIEWAVRMEEFPQEALLDRDGLGPGLVDALAARVAEFHRLAPPAPEDSPYGSPEAAWAPVAASFEHLYSLGGGSPLLRDLECWCQGELRRLRDTIAGRKAAGFVRECHGDLHLGNMVHWKGGPLVFDCIEFSPELRWIDIISDLAFLVMDLSERGRPEYAWRFLNGWLENLGDFAGLEVLRYYQAYRGLVRAKVAAIRAADPGLGEEDRRRTLAGSAAYLDYAACTTAPGRPALLLTHGLSGSGKTTVARRVAQCLGAVHLRSDVERKRLHGLPALARSGSGIAAGLYGEDATTATYGRLRHLAAAILAAGYPVVVDAACLLAWQRQTFMELARERGIPCLILDCRAPAEVLARRVERRRGDASEATPAVLAHQARNAEPLAGGERDIAVAVDAAADPAPLVATLHQRLGRSP